MTVAIVSGTGFLGSAVARCLATLQVPTVCIARGMALIELPGGVTFERADRTDSEALGRVFAAHAVTAIVDIYALGLRNSAAVIEAAARAEARYVMVSSTDVYSNYAGLLRRPEAPPMPDPATEDSPLRRMRYPYRGNPNRPKGVSADLFEDYDKLPVEEALRADGRFPFAILRPPMIFGPGDPQRRFGWALDAARADAPVELDARAAGWLNSYAYVDDVAAALALLATRPEAAGRTCNVAFPHARPQRWWLETVLRLTGRDTAITEVPPERQGLQAARAEAMDLSYPLTLDSRRIRADLGYAERLSVEDALARTIAADTAAMAR
jgi:nucleoside-diphosphate-sugar epimerase